jgi:tripartite ATP-independent transporter DctM subunit
LDWPIILILLFAGLIILMLTGMQIFLAFMIINLVGVVVLFGFNNGMTQFTLSISSSLNSFVLVPIPMFMLLGEILFRTGVAGKVVEVIDQWMGKMPGRLGLMSVLAGTVFAVLTGTSAASTALLGTMLTPEMEKQGYKKSMSLGPILGSGGLAILIPPSSLAIMLGAIGEISIGKLLIAIIVPGLLVAALCAGYIILRCVIDPSQAPPYRVEPVSISKKLKDTVIYVLPLTLVVFLVIGVVILGVATPTEAAASGCVGAFILAALYRKLNLEVIHEAILDTVKNSAMILIIIAASTTFSQILSFSGAGRGFVNAVTVLDVAPMVIIALMMGVIAVMGGFMSLVSIMMICLPIFMPVVRGLGFSDVWFGVIFLINIEMAMLTPPLGMNLYVMAGVAPKDTTMMDIIKAAVPFMVIDVLSIIIIMFVPQIALWLPSLMT